MSEQKKIAPIEISDFTNNSEVVIDPDSDTLTMREIQRAIKEVDDITKGKDKPELTAIEKQKKLIEEVTIDCAKFDAKVFDLVTNMPTLESSEKENEVASSIIQALMFDNPVAFETRVNYLAYSLLKGERLAIYFKEFCKSSTTTLASHIDESIILLDKVHKLRADTQKLADIKDATEFEKTFGELIDKHVQELAPVKGKAMSMAKKIMTENPKVLQSIKTFYEGNTKNNYIEEVFKSTDELFKSFKDIQKKAIDALKKAIEEKVEPAKAREKVLGKSEGEVDPDDSYEKIEKDINTLNYETHLVKPCLFAIVSSTQNEIQRVYKLVKNL